MLKGATYVVGMQLSREPRVRRSIRDEFRYKAVISVRPTKKGLKEIDESHPVYSRRYLKNKIIRDLDRDEYLKLIQVRNFFYSNILHFSRTKDVLYCFFRPKV